MADAPELTSMTRRKTVRPLVAAWAFVIVLLVTGFVWLSLTDNTEPMAKENPPPTKTQDHASASETQAISTPLTTTGPPQQNAANIDPVKETHFPTASEITQSNSPAAGGTTPAGNGLIKAPIDGLIMEGANGPLPVLGPDSLVSWKAYARPAGISDAATNNRPKIAIIVTGIGLNSKFSDLAITQLPGQIDLGFSPYGRKLQNWMDKSREYGHEGFLMIPTEPQKYPENDPGPHTLLAGASTRDNLKKLDWILSQVTGYVGVINEMGSKFTASEEDVLPILTDLNERGLMFLDSKSTRFSVAANVARRIAMPRALNNLFIDNVVTAENISQNLTTLENTARSYGAAVGVARALPITINELEIWARSLEGRGFQLVPITAIANRQPIR